MCQTSSILINVIIKGIIKSIVYQSFQYDTGISFMILIRYDTFDMVHIPNSDIEQKCIRIPTMCHSWISESPFPRGHCHFCYNIQCQHFPGSIRPFQNPQRWRNVCHQNPQACPSSPLWGITLTDVLIQGKYDWYMINLHK